jgi:protease-4
MRDYTLWLAKLLSVAAIVFGVPVFLLIFGAIAQGALGPKVAVVDVRGVIEDSHEILTALYKNAYSDSVKAIVLRVNSPGGAVGPSQEIYEAVKRLKTKKPIVAAMGSVAASGGLYVALSASKVFCQASTQTGSIGVILQVPNVRAVAEKVGVDMITVKSGKLKDAGNMFRDMTAEERVYLERTTSSIHETFMKAVADSRALDLEKIRAVADGRVILGDEAVSLGIADGFGDVYDAAREGLRLANEELKDDQLPYLVFVNRKSGFLDRLAESSARLLEWTSALSRAGAGVHYQWRFLAD